MLTSLIFSTGTSPIVETDCEKILSLSIIRHRDDSIDELSKQGQLIGTSCGKESILVCVCVKTARYKMVSLQTLARSAVVKNDQFGRKYKHTPFLFWSHSETMKARIDQRSKWPHCSHGKRFIRKPTSQ